MTDLDNRSIYLRKLVVRALEGGGRGHIGSSMSLIEIFRVLYDNIVTDDDVVILSKGHGCLAQYALLADKGIIPLTALDDFCRFNALLGGHPSHHIPGVVCDTGSLGHGLSIGVGIALAKYMKQEAGRVFVIVGDGECNEGSVWEAAMGAAKHGLGNLTVIVDCNAIQSAGPTSDIQPMFIDDQFESFGFDVEWVAGHNLVELRDALCRYVDNEPTAIIAHTTKGAGIGFAEGDPYWHHKPEIGPELVERLYDALGGR